MSPVTCQSTDLVWHEETDISDLDVVVIPGFSYGDYLRCGAIARFSPVMRRCGTRSAGKICSGHLQRFSGINRGRTITWRIGTVRICILFAIASLLKWSDQI